MINKTLYMISFIVATVFLTDVAFAGIIVDKKGKGPNGYRDVDEDHTASGHTLTCHNPGNSTCEWVFHKPGIVTSVNNYDIDIIVADVEGLIAGGEASGSYVLDGEISVAWNAATVDEYVLTIEEIEE